MQHGVTHLSRRNKATLVSDRRPSAPWVLSSAWKLIRNLQGSYFLPDCSADVFFSLVFIRHLYLSVARVGCSLNALSSKSWVDLDAPYCWLATSLFWYSCLLSFLKRFWKIAYPAFNIGIIWVLGINVLDIVWRPNTHMTVSKMLLLSQVGPSLFFTPLILLSNMKGNTTYIYNCWSIYTSLNCK